MTPTRERTDDICMERTRRLRTLSASSDVSLDVVESLVESYARLVEDLLDPRAGAMRIEFAYSRLLGTRGSLCRLCLAAETDTVGRRVRQRWAWAETHLRDYLSETRRLEEVTAIAQGVEAGWADSIERFVLTLTARLQETEISGKIGILKGIDTVGLHLAQRELFALSETFAIPLENANAVKLRVRLLSLFLTLHRCGFCSAFPAIQSYRQTFRIHDPLAYPWWFVDCRLSERQINWTYRRLPTKELDWRF